MSIKQKGSWKMTLCLLVLMVTFGGSVLAEETSSTNIHLDLHEAIKLAVDNELNLGQAKASLKAAQAGVAKAEASKKPTMSLNGSYTRLEDPMSTFNIDALMEYIKTESTSEDLMVEGSPNIYSTSLSLQWPIYTGGKITSGIELAKLNKDSAEVELEKQYADTVFQTVQSYINLLKAESFAQVAQNYVYTVKEHLTLVQANLEYGYATKSDLLKTKIQLGQAEQGLVKAEHGVKLAEANLKNLLGLSDQQELSLKEISQAFDFPIPELDEAVAAALQNRSELESLELAKEMAMKNLEMAQAYRQPTVALIGDYSTQGESISLDSASWKLTVNAQWQFSDGGAGAAGIEEAKANLEKVENSMAQAVNGIQLEVKQKYLAISEAKQARELASLNLQQAKENYEFTKAKYELGAATNMDLLTAESTLNQAENDKLNAEYDYYLRVVELFKTIGEIEKIVPGVDENA